MARLNLIFVFILAVCLSIAEAGLRVRRSPQFSQASASAIAFGGNGFPRPGFGGPGLGYGGGNFGPSYGRPGGFGGNYGQGFGNPGFGGGRGFGHSGFGRPGPQFGFGPSQFGQGPAVSIAKSVSISTGGSAISQSSAISSG